MRELELEPKCVRVVCPQETLGDRMTANYSAESQKPFVRENTRLHINYRHNFTQNIMFLSIKMVDARA